MLPYLFQNTEISNEDFAVLCSGGVVLGFNKITGTMLAYLGQVQLISMQYLYYHD